MTFARNERPLFTEIFGPLIGLKEEWERQGASEAELNFSAFTYRCEARGYLPVNTGMQGGLPEVVLEDSEEYLVYRDGLGRRMKMPKGRATLALPQDYPVKNFADWQKLKHLYQYSASRLNPGWEAAAEQFLAEDKVVCVSMPGGFDEPRQLMGEENLCLAYYEQPELVRDMMETMAETAYQVLDQVSARVQVDLLSVHEDMAGKPGPLVGPKIVRDFIQPYYRHVWDLLRTRGARIFEQDSDGNMNPVIPAFLDAGINCMYPMEPAAGMDIVKVRQQYGTRLAFYGGIDKHVLRQDKSAIDAELEYKVPPMIHSGGCVIAVDHRIPNGTPLDNYRYYIKRVWEIINREIV